jgi:hypothetical protein
MDFCQKGQLWMEHPSTPRGNRASKRRIDRSKSWERLWEHMRAHLIYDAIFLALGVLLFASTGFDNATYMSTLDSSRPSIGPKFGTKLTLIRIESLITPQPLCTFESGGSGFVSIARGNTAKNVGDYLVEVKECDPQKGFVVIYLQRTTPFYQFSNWLWSALHLR